MNRKETSRLGLLDALKLSDIEHASKADIFIILYDHGVEWGMIKFMLKPTLNNWIKTKLLQQLDFIQLEIIKS